MIPSPSPAAAEPERVRLRLRFELLMDESVESIPIVSNVLPADAPTRKELPGGYRQVVIPASDAGSSGYTEIRVPAGSYLVEAALPSGRLIVHEIQVSQTSEPVDMPLTIAGSPHEWLGWQHLSGNVGDRGPGPSEDWIEPSFARSRSRRLVHHLTEEPPAAGAAWEEAGTFRPAMKASWFVSATGAGASLRQWEAVLSPLGRPRPGEHGDRPIQRHVLDELGVPPSDHQRLESLSGDPVVEVFRVRADGPTNTEPPRRLRAEPSSRRGFVLVHDRDSASLVSAPVPWLDVDTGEERAFEVLSPLGGEGVTTVVRDPGLGSMLGYMSSGLLPTAHTLVERAEDKLFHKISNPLGAAAGAYVLIATEKDPAEKPWHQWVSNLSQWHEWLPDGAIAQASAKLNHQKKREDVDEALELFLSACRRGLPYYSVGVRLLLDGLTAFADDESYADRRGEIQPWLDRVARVARRTNFQQPFTVIELTTN